MQLPLIRLDRVLHLGTMNAADLGRNASGSSWEGHCLSVSLCPHAWQQIAKLGGHDLHELTTGKGYFLDIHAVKADTDLLVSIVDWAIGEKLAKKQDFWRAWYFDPDIEEWRYFECETEDEAKGQAIDYSDQWEEGLTVDKLSGPDGGPVVGRVRGIGGSRALAKLTGMQVRGPKDGDATDAVIMGWAMEHLPTFATERVYGLWWNETYEPDNLSAPRGGILPPFVKQWAIKTLDLDEIEDVEEALESDLVEFGG